MKKFTFALLMLAFVLNLAACESATNIPSSQSSQQTTLPTPPQGDVGLKSLDGQPTQQITATQTTKTLFRKISNLTLKTTGTNAPSASKIVKPTKDDSGNPFDRNVTYLSYTTRDAEESDYCEYIQKDEGSKDWYVNSPETLKNEENQNIFAAFMPEEKAREALIADIAKNMQDQSLSISNICLGKESKFVGFMKTVEKKESLILAIWNEKTQKLDLFPAINEIADGYYTPTIDAEKGKTLIATGYGDAGHVWWSYYVLDHNKATVKNVESCSGSYVYDEKTEQSTDDFEFECSQKFTPSK